MFLENNYKMGDWNAICDVCGWKFKASQLKKRWDGFMVCDKDFEYRHPMDYYRGPRPDQALPWTRPEAPDQFVDIDYNTLNYVSLTNVAGTYASTPDSNVVDLTGDMECIAYINLIDYSSGVAQVILAKFNSAPNFSYQFWITIGGAMAVSISPDGSQTPGVQQSNGRTLVDGKPFWLRWTVQRDNGSGSHAINFYTSTNSVSTTLASIVWTKQGVTQTIAGTDPTFSGSSSLLVGANVSGTSSNVNGQIYAVYLYSGLGGTLVASMRAADVDIGTTVWTSSLTHEVWTLHGNASIQAMGNQGGFQSSAGNQGQL